MAVEPPRQQPLCQMPPKAPLAMPVQDLAQAPPLRHPLVTDGAHALRWVALGGAALLTVVLLATLAWWLSRDQITFVEVGLITLVGIVGFWIALAATTALIGLWPSKRGAPAQPTTTLDVALLIPVYHETPTEVMAGALAMLRDLASRAPRHRFSLYILSDTRGDTTAEALAFTAMSYLAPPGFPVYYRWRRENTDRKSGNLADWIRGWGRGHDAMVVLDADSLMGARTLLTLADDMAADPKLGLVQTVPQLIDAQTLFARMQAFAGAAYGPLLGRGLARWSGNGANFWGHNAIIRISAFASAAGLPKLPRRFGRGSDQLIWSHDFVEAALLRRRGWAVRLRPDLGESFEQTPPSLIDHVLRDRRWCQGNLQHLRLLRTAGIPPLSRLHLLHGAASYLVSFGWLLLLIVWTAMCFASADRLQDPVGGWPVLVATVVLLLVPKILALAKLFAAPRRCRQFGGKGRLLLSAGSELLLSVLYAPILMVQQSKTILGVSCGITIGWAPQNRQGGQYGWSTLATFHRVETTLGLGLIALITTGLLPIWLAPVGISLAAAIPLSALSAYQVGSAALATPQDRGRSHVKREVEDARDTILTVLEQRRLSPTASQSGRQGLHPAVPIPVAAE